MRSFYLSGIVLFAAASGWAQSLEYPVDVAVDGDGVVYVADHQAHGLLKLEAGNFQVVAKGEGLPRTPLFGIRHITADKEGRWVVSDPATMKLYRVDSGGNVTPVADDERFVTPWGVAVEKSGDILAVDRTTHRLRRIKADGKVEDVAEVHAPRAVLFDLQGGIVVLTDRGLLSIGEGGAAKPLTEASRFELAHDAVAHPNGNYYVTDGYARAIWQISANGEVSALVQGDPLKSPQGLTLDAKGNLLIADAHAQAIFRITPSGEITRLGQ